MSSSCVCHGFNRFTRLKLDPPKSIFSRSVAPPSPGFTHPNYHKLEENNTTRAAAANTGNKSSCDDGDGGSGGGDVKIQRNVDVGGWSFLQFLSNASENHEETAEKEGKVYVHPLVKRSASMLSEKSLEMCTESLGSESSDGGGGISLISLETEICTARDPPQRRPHESSVSRKMSGCVSFPPPLTSISGSNGVQVRPRREGGRLVLEAVVTVTAPHTYFHAERSEGRLRLCILKDFPPNYMENEEDLEEEEEEEEEALDEEEEEALDEDDVEEEVKEGEDIEENNEKVWGEMGVKKMPRLSRCKEGARVNNGLLNWDSFWFATSS